LREVTLSPVGREDPLYKGCPWSFAQPVLQGESIAKLPDGGTVYATAPAPTAGAKPAVRSFAAGIFAFGFEHGWWFDGELLAATLRERGVPDAAAIEAAWRRDSDRSLRAGRRIAEAIALFLMPVDKANAGRVKDLHY
jgi:hypothetical protein